VHAIGDVGYREVHAVRAVGLLHHHRLAVRPPVEVREEPDRARRRAAGRKAESGLARSFLDLRAVVVKLGPRVRQLVDARFLQEVGPVDHRPRVGRPRQAEDLAVLGLRKLLRHEVGEAAAGRGALDEVVQRQRRAGLADLLHPYLGDVHDVGALAHRCFPQVLVSRVAPAYALQRDLDAGILLLELIERGAKLLLFRVVEAEGEVDGTLRPCGSDRDRGGDDEGRGLNQ